MNDTRFYVLKICVLKDNEFKKHGVMWSSKWNLSLQKNSKIDFLDASSTMSDMSNIVQYIAVLKSTYM